MNFICVEFLLALPLAVAVYLLLSRGLRKYFLLGISILAYGYWNGWSLLLLLGVTLAAYTAGWVLAKRRRPWLTAVAVVLILLPLFLFKYLDFLLGTFVPTHPGLNLLLPVGISFYSFQALSYVLDVAAGKTAVIKNPLDFVLFVTYFPQLVAGPIERTGSLLPQLTAGKKPTREDVHRGLEILLTGFAMKLAIADPLSKLVEPVYGAPAQAGGLGVLTATFCFSLQIYCDFAGYSVIAMGASRMLGIRLMENFRQPYLACSLRDFWRRWHISLTGWFTDYIYKPLGGSRRGIGRQCMATLAVFLVSGIWHGANWTFVLWGMLHGLLLVGELLIGKKLPGGWPGRLRTWILVGIAWILFRAQSVQEIGQLLLGLVSRWDAAWIRSDLALLGLNAATAAQVVLRVAALVGLPRLLTLKQEAKALSNYLLVLLVAVCFLAVWAGNGENTFIYFRF